MTESESALDLPGRQSATSNYSTRWLWWAWLISSLLVIFAWLILAFSAWNEATARQGQALQENAIALAHSASLQLDGIQANLSLLRAEYLHGEHNLQPALRRLTQLTPINTVGVFTTNEILIEGKVPSVLRQVWTLHGPSQGKQWSPAQQAGLQHCLASQTFCIGPLLRDGTRSSASSLLGFPVFQPLSQQLPHPSFLIGWIPLADGLFPAWTGLPILHPGASFLLREDGMLLSRYPYSARVNYAEIQTGTVVRHWLGTSAPEIHAFSGYSSAAHAWRVCAARSVTDYHLIAGQCIGRSGLTGLWWKAMQWPTWGAIMLLLLGGAAYRYLARLNRTREAERAHAENVIWEAKEHAEVTLQSIGDGVISTDCNGLVTNMNPIAEELTGWTLAEGRGKPITKIFRIVNEADGRSVENPAERALREGRIVGLANHTILIDRHGNRRSIEDSAAPIRDLQNVVLGTVLVFHDVTEKHDLLSRLSYQATHDLLTGLPNRALYQEHLEQAMRQARRHDTLLMVGFLDLDNFKLVNDRLGHAAGDSLLQHVARCFRDELRGGDLLCRFGGDEFAFFVNDIRNTQEAEILARRIVKKVGLPVDVAGEKITARASIGMTFFPIDVVESCGDLIRHADLALYASKNRGGNTISIFTIDMEEQQDRQVECLRLMEAALLHDYLQLYFQPIVQISGELVGAEALLRMQHPLRGLLSPAEFSEALDHPQLAPRVGRFVLSHALEHMRQWASHSFFPQISINISAQYLLDPKFLEDLEATLGEYSEVVRQNLVLEITESAPMLDFERARETLTQCRALGCKVSLDDFGTGNASLSYLQKLPVSSLKIDQSFIRDILQDPKDYAIVSGMIYVAEMLDLPVVAEGVESVGQIQALHQLRCPLYQGYYYARPMTAAELETWRADENQVS